MALQKRVDILTRKGIKSNQTIAKISETEKKLAIFLVELNNKLYEQRYEQKNEAVANVDDIQQLMYGVSEDGSPRDFQNEVSLKKEKARKKSENDDLTPDGDMQLEPM